MVAVEKMVQFFSTAHALYFGLYLDAVRWILDLSRIR